MEARLDSGFTDRLYVEVASNFAMNIQASAANVRAVVSDVDQLYGKFWRAGNYFDVRGLVDLWFGRVWNRRRVRQSRLWRESGE